MIGFLLVAAGTIAGCRWVLAYDAAERRKQRAVEDERWTYRVDHEEVW